jgi:E3 ubiquitin-protein ligase MARCH6
MRPGAMWFIKDPQDQNSHPIRDILDRPALIQLHKIGISAVMYSVMVVCVVGSVAGLLVLGDKSIMPFRWKNRFDSSICAKTDSDFIELQRTSVTCTR